MAQLLCRVVHIPVVGKKITKWVGQTAECWIYDIHKFSEQLDWGVGHNSE